MRMTYDAAGHDPAAEAVGDPTEAGLEGKRMTDSAPRGVEQMAAPQLDASVACDCGNGYVRDLGAGSPAPLTAQAGECALRAGWRTDRAYQTGWRCPRCLCLARYGETSGPHRYTIREVWNLHRRIRNAAKQAATPETARVAPLPAGADDAARAAAPDAAGPLLTPS